MKITEVLKKEGPLLSFEVFPPKTDTGFENVKNATEEIAKLSPAFMSVTYGAGGGTSKYTLDIAENLMRFNVPTLAHLTCISSTKDTVAQRIRELGDAGIENIMALRGDIPEGHENDKWEYSHAIELVREIRESGLDFCIGGACYPEVHPESHNQKEDIKYLKEKVDAGVDFLTTQMFFDNNLFSIFVYKAREAGINVPIVPGIMPITSPTQIERAIKLSGSFIPRRFISLVDRFGDSPAAMRKAGIIYATDQIIDLYANGFNAVHVYTMNKPDVAEEIQSNLKGILAE